MNTEYQTPPSRPSLKTFQCIKIGKFCLASGGHRALIQKFSSYQDFF